jgi:hypothetical protein
VQARRILYYFCLALGVVSVMDHRRALLSAQAAFSEIFGVGNADDFDSGDIRGKADEHLWRHM